MPVTLSTMPPADGQLRVINISWNMANKEPSQEDVQKILDTYPAGTVADLIVVSCQEETRIRKNGLASKLMNGIGFTGTLGDHNRKTHNTFTGGSPGQVSLTVLSNFNPAPTVQFDEYWDPLMKKGMGPASFLNKGGITANITVPNCAPVNVANFHLESKKDDRKAAELMELWKRVHHINGVDKTYADLTKIAGSTFLMGDGNWPDIAVSHQLASHTTASPYTDDSYNPARILALCGGTGPSHGISTYSGGNNVSVATPLTDRVDSKRVVGKTNTHYMKTGTLDFVSEVGRADYQNKVITTISTPGIDHTPVVARSTPVSQDLSEFERTKKFVVDTIRGLAIVLPPDLKATYEAQLSDLKMLTDIPEHREVVASAFNVYTKILSDYAMPAEIARMEGNASTLHQTVGEHTTRGVESLNSLLSANSELPPVEIHSAEMFNESHDLPPIEALPAEWLAIEEMEIDHSTTPPHIDTTNPHFSDDDEEEAASPVTVAAHTNENDPLKKTVRHVVENSSTLTEAAETVKSEPLVFTSSSFFQTEEEYTQQLQKKRRTESSTATDYPAAAENENTLPLAFKQ